MVNLEQKVNEVHNRRSDINEHIPTILELAKKCDHITEMGVRSIVSTWGWLAGLPKNGLVAYDLHHPTRWRASLDEVYSTAEHYGVPFKFIQADVLKVDIEETDLLFIDTWHAYEQLRDELKRHSGQVKKYICFHDTTSYAHHGENPGHENSNAYPELNPNKGLWDAVSEFLDKNSDTWELVKRYTNNNGFTIIQRK